VAHRLELKLFLLKSLEFYIFDHVLSKGFKGLASFQFPDCILFLLTDYSINEIKLAQLKSELCSLSRTIMPMNLYFS